MPSEGLGALRSIVGELGAVGSAIIADTVAAAAFHHALSPLVQVSLPWEVRRLMEQPPAPPPLRPLLGGIVGWVVNGLMCVVMGRVKCVYIHHRCKAIKSGT